MKEFSSEESSSDCCNPKVVHNSDENHSCKHMTSESIPKNENGSESGDSEEVLYDSFEELIANYEFHPYEYKEDPNYSKEKEIERISQLYEDVMSGARSIDSLSTLDLIRINALLKETGKNDS